MHKTATYIEHPAPPELADLVVCTWWDTRRERRTVLPDACIDIVWDGSELTVAGPDTRPVLIDGDASFAGIRFRPGVAPAFLGVPATELVDTRVALSDLRPAMADELCDRLTDPAAAPDAVLALLADALLKQRSQALEPDRLVQHVVDTFARSSREVAQAAEALGVSERTLRRRCEAALGYGPKTLDRILRFRNAMRLLRARRPLVDSSHLAGYADQSHLTNEFRRLAGTTPAALVRSPFELSANGCN